MTTHTVSKACTSMENCRGAAQIEIAETMAGTSSVNAPAFRARAASRVCCQVRRTSMMAASTAINRSNQTVPGTLPVWKMASVSAP